MSLKQDYLQRLFVKENLSNLTFILRTKNSFKNKNIYLQTLALNNPQRLLNTDPLTNQKPKLSSNIM